MNKAAKRLAYSRSESTKRALRAELKRALVAELEATQREGYRRNPVKPTEFSVWEGEQVWVEW